MLDPRKVAARRALASSDEELLRDCTEEFFVASGPGGQHRNKTQTAVRLTHLPTGLVVTATERRSQAQNRGAAVLRLRRALAELAKVPKVRRATRPTRGSVERRLSGKRQTKQKKEGRRGDW